MRVPHFLEALVKIAAVDPHTHSENCRELVDMFDDIPPLLQPEQRVRQSIHLFAEHIAQPVIVWLVSSIFVWMLILIETRPLFSWRGTTNLLLLAIWNFQLSFIILFGLVSTIILLRNKRLHCWIRFWFVYKIATDFITLAIREPLLWHAIETLQHQFARLLSWYLSVASIATSNPGVVHVALFSLKPSIQYWLAAICWWIWVVLQWFVTHCQKLGTLGLVELFKWLGLSLFIAKESAGLGS